MPLPRFFSTENIILNGEITSNLSDSQLTLKTPYIKYRDFQFENLNFSINPNSNVNDSKFIVDKLSHPYFKSTEFNLTSKKIKDTIFFNQILKML